MEPVQDPVVQPTEPIPSTEEKVDKTKQLCSCGKLISRKNMATHLRTGAHTKDTKVEAQVVFESVKESKKEAADGGLKIKQRFDSIDQKLDVLFDMVADLHEAEYGESDGESDGETYTVTGPGK
jgi:hypothetical protein